MLPCILDKKLVAHRSREETRRAEQFGAVKVEFPRNTFTFICHPGKTPTSGPVETLRGGRKRFPETETSLGARSINVFRQ